MIVSNIFSWQSLHQIGESMHITSLIRGIRAHNSFFLSGLHYSGKYHELYDPFTQKLCKIKVNGA